MGRKVTRRQALKLAGGSALGLLLTPVPWKLVADSALWTQNGEAVPRLPRGAVTVRFSACTLCPAGCTVRARCVAGTPVGLSGAAGDPLTRGALCPAGIAGHQLPWHPERVRSPERRNAAGDAGAGADARTALEAGGAVAIAAGALNRRGPGQLAVILDDRPGRTRSAVYRAFAAAIPGGVYVPSPARESRALETLARQCEPAAGAIRFRIDRAATVVSFGAPLFDGFGGPGTAAALIRARRERGRPGIVLVEPRLSRTAAFADRRLAIRPGTETILALGIAHVLLRDGLVDEPALRELAPDFAGYRDLAARIAPRTAADLAGVAQQDIEETARRLAAGPSIVLGGDPSTGPVPPEEETLLHGLNLLLAAGRPDAPIAATPGVPDVVAGPGAGAAGGPAAPVRELAEIPDRSVRLLILDASDAGGGVAWPALSRKLAPEGSLVVSLSPWRIGLARHADLVVPAAANYESLEEVAGVTHFGGARYRLAAPLLDTPEGAVEPADFLRRVAAAAGCAIPGDAGTARLEDLMKARVHAIHERSRGRIVLPDGEQRPVSGFASATDVWEALAEGAVWTDEEAEPLPRRFRLLGAAPEALSRYVDRALESARERIGEPWLVTASGWTASRGPAGAAPLLTKLTRESGLRDAEPLVVVNPASAAARGLESGAPVRLDTGAGTVAGRLRAEPGVRPGVAHLAVGPAATGGRAAAAEARDLFGAGDPAASRVLAARIREA